MTGNDLQGIREEMRVRPAAMAKKLGISEDEYLKAEDAAIVPPLMAFAVQYLVEHPYDRPSIHVDDVRAVEASEIDIFEPTLFDGRRWGPWRLNRESLTLDLNSRVGVLDRDGDGNPTWGRTEDYYIMLAEITSARSVVDWLGQIAGKGWGPADLGHLTQALDDIFSFQGRFAHDSGFPNFDAARDHLLRVIRPREDDELSRAQQS
jgi:hypothetical protein